jgi:phosphatidate cytidylyltransferase
MSKNMKTRIISGLLMTPLVIIVYFGGLPLIALCFLVGVLGIKEFFEGFRNLGYRPSLIISYAALIILYAVYLYSPKTGWWIEAWLVGVIMASSIYLFKNFDAHKAEDALVTLLGTVYIGFFSFHIVLTDSTGPHRNLIWMIFISAVVTDVFAYFTGVFFGKHKLCPNLSPKKTVEGAAGGIIACGLVSALFGFLFTDGLVIHCLVMGLLGSVFSMLGDLTASAYKRKMGIKDYGDLIPGHGGIMDRFDSLLFTAPVVFYYIQFVLKA